MSKRYMAQINEGVDEKFVRGEVVTVSYTRSYLHTRFSLAPAGAGCRLQPAYNMGRTSSRGIQG